MEKKETQVIRINNPAGAMVRNELEARAITKALASEALGVSQAFIGQVCQGKKTISAELALKLEAFLGIRAELFLKIQNTWKLKEAQREKKVQINKVKSWVAKNAKEINISSTSPRKKLV